MDEKGLKIFLAVIQSIIVILLVKFLSKEILEACVF